MSEEQKSIDQDHLTELTQPEEDDVDALLASLEEEDDSAYRAQRLEELRSSNEATKPPTTSTATNKAFITLKSDDEALSFTTEHERAVVHFFHPDFARCRTMDAHCEQIAETHAQQHEADVSFARIDVKDAPFVVEKLGVRVLPCVIGFVKGVLKGRVTGFEGLCWDGKEGSFAVARALEDTLIDWTVLKRRLLLGHQDEDNSDYDDERETLQEGRRGIRDRKKATENDDDDDDWD